MTRRGYSNSAGSVLTSYTYSPFGQVTSGALPQTTDLGYNSEEYLNSRTFIVYRATKRSDVEISQGAGPASSCSPAQAYLP